MSSEFKIATLPAEENEMLANWIPLKREKLLRLFGGNHTCALYLGYHNSLTKLKPPMSVRLSGPYNAETVGDRELFYAVRDAVRHPRCVQETARRLIDELFGGGDFVAIHWRYDLVEWGKVYARRRSTVDMYKNLLRIRPSDVANGVKRALATLEVTVEKKNLFIATMPSLVKFATQVGRLLRFKNDTVVVRSQKYLFDNHRGCLEQNGWDLEEVVSMLDMELCERSAVFFHSDFSTWSEMVRPKRVLYASGAEETRRKAEFSIYHFAEEARKQRMPR